MSQSIEHQPGVSLSQSEILELAPSEIQPDQADKFARYLAIIIESIQQGAATTDDMRKAVDDTLSLPKETRESLDGLVAELIAAIDEIATAKSPSYTTTEVDANSSVEEEVSLDAKVEAEISALDVPAVIALFKDKSNGTLHMKDFVSAVSQKSKMSTENFQLLRTKIIKFINIGLIKTVKHGDTTYYRLRGGFKRTDLDAMLRESGISDRRMRKTRP